MANKRIATLIAQEVQPPTESAETAVLLPPPKTPR